MEPTRSYIITPSLQAEFASMVEGFIPDLIEPLEPGDGFDSAPADHRDNIHDFVADKSCDLFPNIPDDYRRAMVKEVVDGICGSN